MISWFYFSYNGAASLVLPIYRLILDFYLAITTSCFFHCQSDDQYITSRTDVTLLWSFFKISYLAFLDILQFTCSNIGALMRRGGHNLEWQPTEWQWSVEMFETEKKNLSQSDKQPEGSKDAKKFSVWKIQVII